MKNIVLRLLGLKSTKEHEAELDVIRRRTKKKIENMLSSSELGLDRASIDEQIFDILDMKVLMKYDKSEFFLDDEKYLKLYNLMSKKYNIDKKMRPTIPLVKEIEPFKFSGQKGPVTILPNSKRKEKL